MREARTSTAVSHTSTADRSWLDRSLFVCAAEPGPTATAAPVPLLGVVYVATIAAHNLVLSPLHPM